MQSRRKIQHCPAGSSSRFVAAPSPFPPPSAPLPSLPPQSPQALGRLGALQAQLMQRQSQLWASMFMGASNLGSALSDADRGDRRFSAEAWGADPFHDYLRRAYLL